MASSVSRYRKKTEIIDAVQWTGINVDEVVTWLGEMAIKHMDNPEPGKIHVVDRQKVNFDLSSKPHIKATIVTPQGEMALKHGEYIVCGHKGYLYCCAPDVIEKGYDKVHPEYVEPEGPTVTFQTCKSCGHFLDECDCS